MCDVLYTVHAYNFLPIALQALFSTYLTCVSLSCLSALSNTRLLVSTPTKMIRSMYCSHCFVFASPLIVAFLIKDDDDAFLIKDDLSSLHNWRLFLLGLYIGTIYSSDLPVDYRCNIRFWVGCFSSD